MGELKLAVRTLVRTPFVTAVAVLSLALGIGANAAIFSLFDQMLLRRLPVPEPERLVNLQAPGPKPGSQSCGQAGNCSVVLSYPMFRDLEAADGPLEGLAAHRLIGVNLSHTEETSSGTGLLVSGSFFSVMGLQPAMGRLLTPDDDRQVGAHYVTVLSWRFWQNRLGGDRSVLNQTLMINGQPMTVVGVAPRGFEGPTPGARVDVYVPITMRGVLNPRWDGFDSRRSYWVYAIGRLKPGVTLEAAATELNSVYGGIINEVEAPLQEGMTPETLERFRAKRLVLEPGARGQSSLREDAGTPLVLLISITGMVLLIACANIANLLLARGAARAQELAVRSSLGAGRGRLLRQLLTEALLLAVTGGALSLLVAQWTLSLLSASFPAEVRDAFSLSLDARVALFAGAVAVVTGLVFGLYPALHSTRSDLVTALKSGAGQPSGARQASRFRNGLVTAQIALSMALLVAAGLFIQSLRNVSAVDLGIDTSDVVTFVVSPDLNGYEAERTRQVFERMEEELASIPGVRAVTAGMVPVLAGSSWGTDVSVEGFESGPGVDSNARYNAVAPAYFSTLGIPLIAGREFDASDGDGAPKVAIVNQAFARKFGLDERAAVGTYMSTGGGGQDELDIRIVGVVQDAAYNDVKQPPPPMFVLPYRQTQGVRSMAYYLRTSVDPTQVLRAVPEVVKRVDPNLPVEELKTLERQVDENVFADRILTTLSAAFAVLATLLAGVGLYGVLAYTVAQRTREFGLRMALGAPAERVRGLVLRQVGRMTLLGAVLGLGAAYFVGRGAQSLLFGLEGLNAWVVVTVSVLLGVVALGAGYVPALRASRVDPMEALRYE